MMVVASSAEVPITMHKKQFEFKRLPVVDTDELNTRSQSKATKWTKTYSDRQHKTGENLMITKNEMVIELLLYQNRKDVDPDQMMNTIPFRLVIDSGMRSYDFFDLAQYKSSKGFVWFLQIASRAVEAHRSGKSLTRTPLIHPLVGVNYQYPEHKLQRLPNKIVDYVPFRSGKKWMYAAVGNEHVDLITIP